MRLITIRRPKISSKPGRLGFEHPVAGIFTTAPNGWTYASHEFGNIFLMIPTAALNDSLGRFLNARHVASDKVSAGTAIHRILSALRIRGVDTDVSIPHSCGGV